MIFCNISLILPAAGSPPTLILDIYPLSGTFSRGREKLVKSILGEQVT